MKNDNTYDITPWIDRRAMIYIFARHERNPFKIIDIGCGTHPIFDSSVNVDNVTPEYWKSKIKKQKESGLLTKERFETGMRNIENLSNNFFLADACHLPFKNSTFNFAILSEIIEHLKNPEDAVNEAQRVAKVVLLSVPNESEWDKAHKPFEHTDHFTIFDEEKLLKLVDNTGLRYPEMIKINWLGWSHFVLMAISKHEIMIQEELKK